MTTPEEKQQLEKAIEKVRGELDECTVSNSCIIVDIADVQLIVEFAKRVPELEQQLAMKDRDIQLLLSELSGMYKGLMLHPTEPSHDGYCISQPSKQKLSSIQDLIKRYEQH